MYNFRVGLGIGFRENRKLLILLFLSILVGVGVGASAVFDPQLHHFRITRELLDGNIVNVASPARGIFTFFLVRFMDFGFGLLLVFLLNMTKWTFLFTFPYLAFRAFWMMINLFWIIDRFGFMHGSVLFIVYLVVLVTLLIIFACACVFIIKRGRMCRMYGFRSGLRWMDIRRSVYSIVLWVAFVAFVEWLMYILVLSRLVFIL